MEAHQAPLSLDSPGKNTGVGCHFLLQCMEVKSESEVAQLCLTPSDPMDCSPPGSSVHGIFQARVLEWGAIAFSVMRTYYGPNPGILKAKQKKKKNKPKITFLLPPIPALLSHTMDCRVTQWKHKMNRQLNESPRRKRTRRKNKAEFRGHREGGMRSSRVGHPHGGQ